MAGNFRASAGVEPAQSRTSVSGGFRLPARPAPAPAPAGYQLVYQMGGPRYMYGETPRYAAQYSDGGTVPGQIYGNMRGSREGADMFGFFPTMFQSQPYATASQMYTPSLGVMPLIGYPSKYPHVVMGGYTDYGAPIANQAMNMMLPLLMMGLYRQMFPMAPQAPAQAAKGSGGGKGGSGGGGAASGGGASAQGKDGYKYHYAGAENDWNGYESPSAYHNPLWKGPTDVVGPLPGTPAQMAEARAAQAAQAAQAVQAESAAAPAPGVTMAPAIRSAFPKVDRLMRGAALVPSAVKGAAGNAFLPGSDSTHAALVRARDNPVAVPDNVRRAFGGR